MRRIRGVAHVHSRYSFDGRLTLEELAAFLRERGVDFVLLSEHVETLTPASIRSFISECRMCSSESLLMVPGIEIDALNALFYGVQAVDSWTDNADLARQLAAGGAMVAISHPVKVKRGAPPVTESLVEAVEVWNSRHDGKLAIDQRIVRFWLATRASLARPLLPLCGIDFHKRDDFIPLTMELDVERLDRDEVLAGIRAGRYEIVRAGRRVPLDFTTGRLAAFYRLNSFLYRTAYQATYSLHRAVLRLGIRPPGGLRSRLRKVF